ncbi:glucoamylase family protein [Yersinia pseudotuberculosis IP 32953]|uniref:Glycoamylase-like domain-containing protein n=2 Tax=Yersinia pseudotuberculosis TaxID=633 RepID=A0ABM7AGW1_YERPU|nr:glucoamylase family protein [Yersinia pseudotuberculosis]CQD58369.1 membrane protein [Yersinia intermedia]AJJ01059.1 glucoamylase family protein [Yersinia pseudotuberculosis]AJJ54657.1 glucoamylase family protein [Yersinia pseudotuberculosis IP 32953]AJJ67501.1 glucoamylase family protein [Yersinia pseudotuberculosis PB1/+]AJJ71457.1 glucoamylase family protein [Yersinia pseudotuberculosis]
MINKRKIVLAAILLTVNGGLFAQSVVIDQLKVSEHLYPKGFESEFQNNLDFYRDGVGVDEKAKVPYDTIRIEGTEIVKGYYTNTTEVGLYLNILTESVKAGNLQALQRIKETLTTLEQAPKWNGLFYWPYDIRDGKLVTNPDEIVPAVDNGNLSFALAGVAGAFLDSSDADKQEIVQRIEAILDGQKPGWAALYDENKGLLSSGWSTKNNASLGYFVDRKGNESRAAVAWAVLATKDMGAKALPVSAFSKMELYTQRYEINGKQYNPLLTWDGAYFQMMMPQIWLNERELMPNYGIVEDHTFIQKVYASKHGIPMVSSSATTDNAYHAFGVPQLSESKVRFKNKIDDGYTGTPHAIALSYIVDPAGAISALKKLKQAYPNIESPYGWYDAVDSNGKISKNILSLDVGMFVGAFLAKEINADVEKYLQSKGDMELLKEMYQSYVPNNYKPLDGLSSSSLH